MCVCCLVLRGCSNLVGMPATRTVLAAFSKISFVCLHTNFSNVYALSLSFFGFSRSAFRKIYCQSLIEEYLKMYAVSRMKNTKTKSKI